MFDVIRPMFAGLEYVICAGNVICCMLVFSCFVFLSVVSKYCCIGRIACA